MNAYLHYLLAQQRIADLQRAAERARLATDAGADRRDSRDWSPIVRALPMPTAHPSPEAWPDAQRAARCSWQSRQITRSRAKGNKFRCMHRRQLPVAEATDLPRWIPRSATRRAGSTAVDRPRSGEPAGRHLARARRPGRREDLKNGLARPITLPPRALEALGMVTRRRDSPYVFHSPRGKRLSKGSLN